jgi:hypothetical protein
MMQWNQSYFESFTQKLESANVTYLFLNLPNLNNDSSLNDNFTLDSLLILRFDQIVGNYTFQYIAWTGTQSSPNTLLANFTYSGINETAASLYKAGFDGILVDIEPVPNDSPTLITMLKDFRTAMNNYDQSSLLAVNSMNIHYGAAPGQLWSWDPQYYQNISGLVNFISPMLFESGSENQSQYVSYAIPQIQLAEQYSKSPILYSIPNWYENSTYHNPLGENLQNAIIAFRAYIDQGYYPKLNIMMGLGIWGLNKTYILSPGTQTKALDTTSYDWSYFITNWVETSYPAHTGTALA